MSRQRYIQPSALRVVIAFSAAIFAGAAIPAVGLGYMLKSGHLPTPPMLTALMVTVIAAAHALLGVPAYLALRRHYPFGWVRSLLGGLLIGMGPSMILFCVILVSGSAEWDSPWLVLARISPTGGFGMIGGAVFRWVLGAPEPDDGDFDATIFE